MNRIATTACLLAATAAFGAQAETFPDTARVRSVEPQYETVQVPRNECSSQWVSDPQPVVTAPQRSYGGAIIGGVAGAVLGNQIGKGHGREAATAVGAIAGAVTGDRIDNANGGGAVVGYQQQPREVTTCRTVNEVQNRLTGYRVTYEYRGRQSTVLMRRDPGPTLPVEVSVVPVEREYHRSN